MKKLTSILLALTMLLSITATAFAAGKDYPQNFWDVPKDHWAFSYIAELVNRGVISGYEDGSFRPDDTVTRGEWAKIMVLAAGLKPNDNNVYFTDMAGHWANIYINSAKDYLAAYTDGGFKPDQAAAREDVTVSMVKLKGYDVSRVDYSHLNQFKDTASISNSLKQYVAVAIEKGLITGFEDNTFRGQDTLTRAEAATLLWRAFQYGNDNKVVDTPTQTTPAQNYQNPVETPKQTPTPTPTTQTSTAETNNTPATTPTEPEPTQEPEPTETPKPYKIETLAKANITNGYCYTQDNSNNIYYADDNKIYSVSIDTRDKKELLDITDLDIDNEEMTLADFAVESVCYDNYEKRLMVLGVYNAVNAINKPNNHYLYAVDNGGVALITDNFYADNKYMIGVLSNGDYVMSEEQISRYKSISGGVIDKDSFTKKCYLDIVNDVVEVGDNLYYVQGERPNEYVPYTYYFTEYDFVKANAMWEVGYNINAVALGDNVVAIVNGNTIDIRNFKGKMLSRIKPEDCRIADKTATSFSEQSALVSIYISGRLLLCNGAFVFYDSSANAFRVISKND